LSKQLAGFVDIKLNIYQHIAFAFLLFYLGRSIFPNVLLIYF